MRSRRKRSAKDGAFLREPLAQFSMGLSGGVTKLELGPVFKTTQPTGSIPDASTFPQIDPKPSR